MTKRVFITLLWAYAGWYLGAEIAYTFSINPALGPILGVAAAILVLYDPRRISWRTRSVQRRSPTAHPSTH